MASEPKTVLIACSMIEDELNSTIRRFGLHNLEVVWMERGYHDEPEDLHRVIQERIDAAESNGAERILLAYGLCGNGAIGWTTRRATLAMPRFDDCVNMMLCPAKRSERNLLESGKMYLTKGWTQETGSVGNMLDQCRARYGDKKGLRAMKLMLSAYHHLTVVDTGAYELEQVIGYAHYYAAQLGFETEIVPGTMMPFEHLLTGDWDEHIIVKQPGEVITEEDFEI